VIHTDTLKRWADAAGDAIFDCSYRVVEDIGVIVVGMTAFYFLGQVVRWLM